MARIFKKMVSAQKLKPALDQLKKIRLSRGFHSIKNISYVLTLIGKVMIDKRHDFALYNTSEIKSIF